MTKLIFRLESTLLSIYSHSKQNNLKLQIASLINIIKTSGYQKLQKDKNQTILWIAFPSLPLEKQ